MKYQVVRAFDESISKAVPVLEKKVEELLKGGWRPQGGIAMLEVEIGIQTFYFACQAMVKDE